MRTSQLQETSRGVIQHVYVDPVKGVDTNPGTMSMPFQTITAALASITDASAVKRYAVVLAPGNYVENVVMIPWVTIVGASFGVDSAMIQAPVGHTVTFPAAMAGDGAAVENVRIECQDPAVASRGVFCDNGGSGTLRNCSVANTGGGDGTECVAGGVLLHYDCAVLAVAAPASSHDGFGGYVGGSYTGDGVAPDVVLTAAAVVILTPDVQLGNLTINVVAGATIMPRTSMLMIPGVELNPANWAPGPGGPTPLDLLEAIDRIATQVVVLSAAVPIP